MSTKTVNLYDPVSFIYQYSYVAQESPLEKGVFIIPSSSTDIAPPNENTNQVAVFLNGTWKIESDYRGQTWYDKTTGASTQITTIGQPSSSLTNTPVKTLAQVQTDKINSLTTSYNAAIQLPVTYMG